MYRPVARTAAKQLACTGRPVAARGYAAYATPQPFDWEDPLNSQNLFTEEELAIRETAESYCQDRMLPRVLRKSIVLVGEWDLIFRHNRGISR
jgi:glutaryl-CoA dehydrogenase